MSDSLPETKMSVQASREDVRRMVTIEVGQRLRLVREEQQLSLATISDKIKLRPTQLEALESGNWQLLPNDTLAHAFLRQYAAYLKVNIDETLQQLKSEALSFHHPLTFPDPAIAPNKRWAIVAASLFVLLLLSWNLLGSNSDAPLPAVIQLAPIAVEKILPAAAIKTTPVMAKMVKKKDEVKPTPVEVVRQPFEKPLPHPVKHALAEPTVEKAAPVVVVKSVIKKHAKPVSSSKKAAAQPVGTHEFSFQAAKHRVWLLLEIPDGKGGRKRLREVIIRPHHSIEVTRKNGSLFVSVGNAGAIKITYGGKTLYDFGKFGPRGMVIRHRKVAVPSEQATEAASQ